MTKRDSLEVLQVFGQAPRQFSTRADDPIAGKGNYEVNARPRMRDRRHICHQPVAEK
jgi:hypothetical protein